MNRPYDNKGQFVPLACRAINCGSGRLQYEGLGVWQCDGLAEPERDDQPLYACGFAHIDGEPKEQS